MTVESFDLLVSIISPALTTNIPRGEEPILPEIMLHCAIRYLAGGSVWDIIQLGCISKPSFYSLVWRTVAAINNANELVVMLPSMSVGLKTQAEQFAHISSARDMNQRPIFGGCVGCIDGYLQPFKPTTRDQNDLASYFNGHYQRHGINCQAMCDHISRFTFFAVISPGSVNDVVALDETDLKAWIDSLGPDYYVVGDNAYRLT
jgi:hypothetical protein